MTSRYATQTLSLPDASGVRRADIRWSDRFYRWTFGAIGWPWLLVSLWGGTKASKRRLLERVGLTDEGLPKLGSWKADTGFLHRIVDTVEELRPRTVVELGAGASTLVCARALQMNGGGRLLSFDQHAGFATATARWVEEEGACAEVRHAPLRCHVEGWPGTWYDLGNLPDRIDLLIIDGPPWAIHPFVRGAAECLFDRIAPGGMILLDDAARPGERLVARRWRREWPQIEFKRLRGSTKGTLVGRRRPEAKIVPMPPRRRAETSSSSWRRAAAAAALLAAGWGGHELTEEFSSPAYAAPFLEAADASYMTSAARQRMKSQIESTLLDRSEIVRATGLNIPQVPRGWSLADVQVYPSDRGMAVTLIMYTDEAEEVLLYGTRAETPAEKLPLLEQRQDRAIAYWEEGPYAFALTGKLSTRRILTLASELAEQEL